MGGMGAGGCFSDPGASFLSGGWRGIGICFDGGVSKKIVGWGHTPTPPHSFFCISTFQNLGLKVVPPSRNGGTDTMIIRRDFQKCTVWSLVFVCFFMITNQKISSNFIISCKFASLFLLFILSVHQIIHLFLNKQSIFDPHLKNCLSFPKRWPPKIV